MAIIFISFNGLSKSSVSTSLIYTTTFIPLYTLPNIVCYLNN